MSLTHKFLKAMGIEAEQAEQILEEHSNTLSEIKAERDKAVEQAEQYKVDAEKYADTKKELEGLKEIKTKYETLQADFEKYKGEQTEKETKASKAKAYRQLLKDAGVSEKRIDTVMKVADVDSIELDADGNIKDADKHTESIKSEWGDFIESTGSTGASTSTPPKNNGGKMTKDEILNIKDTSLRQAKMAENHELFGI